MEGFLATKPALTPLVAGASTTMITGTLASQFGFPGNWTAIVVSLLLAALVSIDKTLPLLQRILFYVLNAITIFTMAMGINAAGVAATQPQYEQRWIPPAEAMDSRPAFFENWF